MFVVRPMTVQDITSVMEVNKKCFSTPWSSWAIRYDLEQNPYSYWMILEQQIPISQQTWLRRFWKPIHTQTIGFGGFWIIEHEAHITSIGVDPDFRGRGWGEVLLVTMLKYAITQSASFSSLEVRVSNDLAINLYKKYKYRIIGRKKGYYHDNQEDAFDMATTLFDSTYQQLLDQHVAALAQRLHWQDWFLRKVIYET